VPVSATGSLDRDLIPVETDHYRSEQHQDKAFGGTPALQISLHCLNGQSGCPKHCTSPYSGNEIRNVTGTFDWNEYIAASRPIVLPVG